MDSALSILAAVNLNYLKAQVVLLPLAVVYLAVLGTRAMRLRHRVWLHDGLLAASLALPVAVALASLLPRVQVTDGLVMPALAVAAAAEQGLAAPRMFPWYSLAAAVGLLGVVWFLVQLGRQLPWNDGYSGAAGCAAPWERSHWCCRTTCPRPSPPAWCVTGYSSRDASQGILLQWLPSCVTRRRISARATPHLRSLN